MTYRLNPAPKEQLVAKSSIYKLRLFSGSGMLINSTASLD